jgi:hypothetical protein
MDYEKPVKRQGSAEPLPLTGFSANALNFAVQG